jgi:hypothetical protein
LCEAKTAMRFVLEVKKCFQLQPNLLTKRKPKKSTLSWGGGEGGRWGPNVELPLIKNSNKSFCQNFSEKVFFHPLTLTRSSLVRSFTPYNLQGPHQSVLSFPISFEAPTGHGVQRQKCQNVFLTKWSTNYFWIIFIDFD